MKACTAHVALTALSLSLLAAPAHAQAERLEDRLIAAVVASLNVRSSEQVELLVIPSVDCLGPLPGDPMCQASQTDTARTLWAAQRAQSVANVTGGRLVSSLREVAALQSNRGAQPLTTCASTQEFLNAVTVESIVVRSDTSVVRLSQAVVPRDARCAGSASSTDYFIVKGEDGALRVAGNIPGVHHSGLRLPPP